MELVAAGKFEQVHSVTKEVMRGRANSYEEKGSELFVQQTAMILCYKKIA